MVESSFQGDKSRVYWLNGPDRWGVAPVGAAIMAGMGVSLLFPDDFGTRAIGVVAIALSVVFAAWAMFYVRLVLTEDALIIRNIRTRTIPYADVEQVKPEYEGLVVRAYGRRFTAVAIQRWNISLFLRRRTRADFIADEIRLRVDSAPVSPRGHSSPSTQ